MNSRVLERSDRNVIQALISHNIVLENQSMLCTAMENRKHELF